MTKTGSRAYLDGAGVFLHRSFILLVEFIVFLEKLLADASGHFEVILLAGQDNASIFKFSSQLNVGFRR
jgi:hypothetical protein